MTAYQFAFYTLYQFFEFKALDKASAWKANVVISVLEAMTAVSIYSEMGILCHFLHRSSEPYFFVLPSAVIVVFGITVAILNYYAFSYQDRWKRYVEQFKKYPKNKLIMGRLAVLGAVIAIVAFWFFALYHGSRTYTPLSKTAL